MKVVCIEENWWNLNTRVPQTDAPKFGRVYIVTDGQKKLIAFRNEVIELFSLKEFGSDFWWHAIHFRPYDRSEDAGMETISKIVKRWDRVKEDA